jgi:FkbM family methyltransferase
VSRVALRLKGAAADAAISVARRLPVTWLRMFNRFLYRTPSGRRTLERVWTMVGDRPVVIPRGGLAGFSFVTGGGQPEYALGASEPAVQATLDRCIGSGDVLYDVGANVGFFTLLGSRRAGATGCVYAFEPVEVNVQALRRNLELNAVGNVEVHQTALSNAVATVRMALGRDQATGHLAETGEDLIVVPCTTIDAFVAAGHRPPSVVKIDVEGAEDLVLAGMRATLRERRPLVLCELHHQPQDPRLEVIGEILREVDYDQLPLVGGSMPHVLAVPAEVRDEVLRRLGPHVRLAAHA